MTYLLSEEGRRAMRTLAGLPILYAFDFDGTLAPISADREGVKIPRSVAAWLEELAKRAPCAVVSGRSLSDLAPRIDGIVPYVVGNHGIESPISSPATLCEAEETCAAWKRELQTGLALLIASLGAEIEDKRYSLTVHLRRASDPGAAGMEVSKLLRHLVPKPHLITGKYSVNALPPWQSGKGPAALALMTQLRQTGLFYIGDEDTDESVFALTEGLAMGVRVGAHPESRAQYYLKHQGETEELLRFLVHRLDRTPDAFGMGHDERTDAL